MRQYAVCEMVGEGTMTSPYRPKVADYGVNYVIVVSPTAIGNEENLWVLAMISGTSDDIRAMGKDPQIEVLPFGPENLSQSWTSLGTRQQRTTYANEVTAYTGVTVTRDDPRTLYEIITALGEALDPTFNASVLEVVDVTA